jgi:hypothetical protein
MQVFYAPCKHNIDAFKIYKEQDDTNIYGKI